MLNKKQVAIIVDKTTDAKGHSVVNTLFSYYGVTKLVSVDFLQSVNYSTIGELILWLLIE